MEQALKALAGLSVVCVLFQFITAGRLFPSGGPEQLHAVGAIFLHVFTGLTAGAAVLLWRTGHRSRHLAILAVVVFAFTFVQAAVGGRGTLWLHIPGAMIMTVGVVWLLALALGAQRRSRRSA